MAGIPVRGYHRAADVLPPSIAVIYCVVPEALSDELFEKLERYYADDPNVTVIVDRRQGSRRDRTSSGGGNRELRDRRRPRVTGEIPQLTTD
jgi:hypothetical protein